MISFSKACEQAYDYYADLGFRGLRNAKDIGDQYVFLGYANPIPFGGIVPIAISKKSGELEELDPFLQKNAEILRSGQTIPIPDEFKPIKNT